MNKGNFFLKSNF